MSEPVPASGPRASGVPVALSFFLQGWTGMTIMIALPFCLTGEGSPEESATLVALVFALPALAGFLGTALFGRRFDRAGRARPLLFAALLAHAALHGVFLAPPAPGPLLALLFLASFVGAALTPALTAHVTLIARAGSGERLAGLFLMESVGWGAGCVVGMIYGAWPARAALGALAATGLFLAGCALASILLFREAVRDPAAPAASVAAAPPSVGTPFRAFARVLADPELARFAALTLGVILVNSVFFSMSSLYYERHLAGPRAWYTMSMAGASILGALSYPLFGRLCDRIGGARMLRLALGLYLATYLVIAFFPSPLTVALVYAIPLYPAVRIASNHIGAGRSGAAERGTAMGAVNALHPLAALLAPLLARAVVAAFGLGALPAVVCALFVALILWERATAR